VRNLQRNGIQCVSCITRIQRSHARLRQGSTDLFVRIDQNKVSFEIVSKMKFIQSNSIDFQMASPQANAENIYQLLSQSSPKALTPADIKQKLVIDHIADVHLAITRLLGETPCKIERAGQGNRSDPFMYKIIPKGKSHVKVSPKNGKNGQRKVQREDSEEDNDRFEGDDNSEISTLREKVVKLEAIIEAMEREKNVATELAEKYKEILQQKEQEEDDAKDKVELVYLDDPVQNVVKITKHPKFKGWMKENIKTISEMESKDTRVTPLENFAQKIENSYKNVIQDAKFLRDQHQSLQLAIEDARRKKRPRNTTEEDDYLDTLDDDLTLE
jgi:predicted nucleic acid-binding protein